MARSLAEALREAFALEGMGEPCGSIATATALAWLASPDGLLSDAAVEAAARDGIERGRIWGDLGAADHIAAIADARAAVTAALAAISERTEA